MISLAVYFSLPFFSRPFRLVFYSHQFHRLSFTEVITSFCQDPRINFLYFVTWSCHSFWKSSLFLWKNTTLFSELVWHQVYSVLLLNTLCQSLAPYHLFLPCQNYKWYSVHQNLVLNLSVCILCLRGLKQMPSKFIYQVLVSLWTSDIEFYTIQDLLLNVC